MATTPEKLRVIARTPGRGGVVEVPVAVPAIIDLQATASRARGKVQHDTAAFEEMVRNFAAWDGVVPVNLHPHRNDNGGPVSGHYQKVFLEGGKLWARLFLNEAAFQSVVERQEFFGYSGEFKLSPQRPTQRLEGWAITGGVFTNVPATGNALVAAERITEIVHLAIADGRADPGEFEGLEGDPVAWLDASPYRSAAALERELAGRTAPLQLTERQRRELESAGFTESDISKLCMAAGRRGGDPR